MRQRDEIEAPTAAFHLETAADDLVELLHREKLCDREFADGDDEARTEDFKFGLAPGSAVSNFIGRGDAIPAGSGFAGKAATNGSEINAGTGFVFIPAAKLLEPTEESAPSRPGKWTAEDGLLHARRLTDEDDPANDGSARHGRRDHARAASALAQGREVRLEEALGLRAGRASYRRKNETSTLRTMLRMMQVTMGK